MLDRTDHYRTRGPSGGQMLPRNEPVIHSRGMEVGQGPLTDEQLRQFEESGFLWLDSFFPKSVTAQFFDELDALVSNEAFCDRPEVIMDQDRKKIRSIFAMHEFCPAFDRLTRDGVLLRIVRQLLGEGVYIHQSRINNKAGFCGSGFEWHSDFETWHSEDGMPEMRAVSVSIMLTDNNQFNGPLMLIPGSHKYFIPCAGETPDRNWEQSLNRQLVGLPSRDALSSLANTGGIEAPTGPAGSLLLFDCNTLHASNRNMSPWPRANLFFVYNAVSNRLVQPFGSTPRRPECLAARRRTPLLTA